MAGMKKLAPRLQKIKETYEGDKQKIGKKTMELYRTEKINPAAGCLPNSRFKSLYSFQFTGFL
jgi:YidC/Oxa1 family membrane protein insertase